MKQFISSVTGTLKTKRNIFSIITVCIILACTAMAFQDSTKVNIPLKKALLDSPPENTNLKIEIDLKDLDRNIKKSMEAVEKSMKDIDWSSMSKHIQESLKQIDVAKLQLNIDKAMKDIDWNKMKVELDASKLVDMDKLKTDLDKMKTEIKLSMKDFNSDELKKNMEELKKLNFDDMKKDMEKMKIELEKNKDQLKLELEKSKLNLEKVKTSLTEIKEMTSEMEKDGLINKSESNDIEYKNKELFINGKKQSPEITEKYRKYFSGDHFNIKSGK